MVRRVQFGLTRVEPVLEYDEIDTSTNFASGDVIAQGYASVMEYVAGLTQNAGFAALDALSATAAATRWYTLMAGPTTGISSPGISGGLMPVRTKFKGRFQVNSNNAISAANELFAIGFCLTGPTAYNGVFGNATEATRDDVSTIAGVVRPTTFNVQGYNCLAAGNANYDPSVGTLVIDNTGNTGFPWELSIDVPSVPTGFMDCSVSISIGGFTVYSAQAPVATTNGVRIIPAMMINLAGICGNIFYEISRL